MKLELFYRSTCPYCVRVVDFLEQNDLLSKVVLTSITEESNRLRLIEVGGKQQVPCLFIDGEPLYESSDIIQWFSSNF